MKHPTWIHLGLTVLAVLALAACTPIGQAPLPPLQSAPTAEQAPAQQASPAPEVQAASPEPAQAPAEATSQPAALANPASQNCVAKGGTLKIEERGDGGQIGVCYFEDNLQCEEWALMRGECPAGGIKITGYITDAARYCAITGGGYSVTANSGQADEQGSCTLPGGQVCDAADYYNGKCDASTAAEPAPAQPASTGLSLKPATVEICDGVSQALSQALSNAASSPTPVEVTESEAPMNDPSSGASGMACRATAKGTGEQFASPDAVLKAITAVLTGGGWVEDPKMAAGGPTGIGSGYRSRDLVTIAGVIWLPDPAANCPNDQPISACQLTPAQQLYTITLDTAQTVGNGSAAMANPASQNCATQGGKVQIENGPDGGQYGVCVFGDNMQCEEWALLRGQCPVGGVKVTGYTTAAATYCAITGGGYAVTGKSGQVNEQGTCSLPDGTQCEVWSYYQGACQPGGATQ